MANVTVSVYQAARNATSSANYTDNKTAATTGNTYYIANNGHVGLVLECTAGGTATVVTTGAIDASKRFGGNQPVCVSAIVVWHSISFNPMEILRYAINRAMMRFLFA